MDVIPLTLGTLQTNAFLVGNAESGEALVIDVPNDAVGAIRSALKTRGWKLRHILLTHGHFDHIADAQPLRAATGAEVIAHPGDHEWMRDPMAQASVIPFPFTIEPVEVDRFVEHDDTLELLGQIVAVRHTPGHAPGNVTFVFGEQGWAFVGDTLFAGSVGRPDLPGGDWTTLEKSIREQLFTLPGETQIYPGHGAVTTVAREKQSNPFLT
jgi:glyoxylase-like metal-dependent hydrolase (beta-lactamase superfamily II)